MDSDFWTSHFAAAKRQFNLQHHHLHHGLYQSHHLDSPNVDECLMTEEEVRPDFPCPYCYEDFDIVSLCSHLKDEHSSESKATICPICSVKVARDMLTHITLQHGHLFKLQRRRRLHRDTYHGGHALSLLGRDLREARIQVLQRGSTYRSNINASNVISDPLISSLVMNYPSLEAEEILKTLASTIEDTSAKTSASPQMWKLRFDPSMSSEEREKRIKQAALRAVFVQDLFASTLSIT